MGGLEHEPGSAASFWGETMKAVLEMILGAHLLGFDPDAALHRPGSWEWASMWGERLRDALEAAGYEPEVDPDANWRRVWVLWSDEEILGLEFKLDIGAARRSVFSD